MPLGYFFEFLSLTKKFYYSEVQPPISCTRVPPARVDKDSQISPLSMSILKNCTGRNRYGFLRNKEVKVVIMMKNGHCRTKDDLHFRIRRIWSRCNSMKTTINSSQLISSNILLRREISVNEISKSYFDTMRMIVTKRL